MQGSSTSIAICSSCSSCRSQKSSHSSSRPKSSSLPSQMYSKSPLSSVTISQTLPAVKGGLPDEAKAVYTSLITCSGAHTHARTPHTCTHTTHMHTARTYNNTSTHIYTPCGPAQFRTGYGLVNAFADVCIHALLVEYQSGCRCRNNRCEYWQRTCYCMYVCIDTALPSCY